MKVPVNGSLFSIVEIDGPIRRGNSDFPSRIRYDLLEIHLLKALPEDVKKFVLAATVAEACHRHRVPLVWPRWVDPASTR